MKNQKAITLIALIITIIVLLILAGVTINMVMGENGIVNKAKASVGKYKDAQENENSILSGYEAELDSYINGDREKIMVDKDEYENLKAKVETLGKKPILIERGFGTFSSSVTANAWTNIATIPLGNYGTGTATLSAFASNWDGQKIGFIALEASANSTLLASDDDWRSSSENWLRTNITSTFNYNSSTSVTIKIYGNIAFTPYFRYSIIIYPD